MVGEPYHGGDFMTLTQRAKEQQVPMTEELGGKMGKALKYLAFFFWWIIGYYLSLPDIGGLLVDDWWMIGGCGDKPQEISQL